MLDAYRRQRPDQPLEAAANLIDADLTPDELTLANDAARALRSMLAELPASQQRVLELRLAGLTGPEIAGVLDRSIGSVRLLQHRAMVTLRDRLNATVDDEETFGGRA